MCSNNNNHMTKFIGSSVSLNSFISYYSRQTMIEDKLLLLIATFFINRILTLELPNSGGTLVGMR